MTDQNAEKETSSGQCAATVGLGGTFRREIRYAVLKWKDAIAALTPEEVDTLHHIMWKTHDYRESQGKHRYVDCVVIEKDWPEYEPTWRAIEARMKMPSGQSDSQEEEMPPLERLRFFCSNVMKGQDWIDVEPFFDGVTAELSSQAVQVRKLDATVANWENTSKSQSANYATLALTHSSTKSELAEANETIKGLAAAARFWHEKADGMSEEIVALQARDVVGKQEPVLLVIVEENDGGTLSHRISWSEANQLPIGNWPVFTHPPITSERELELLAVIEQMREKNNAAK